MRVGYTTYSCFISIQNIVRLFFHLSKRSKLMSKGGDKVGY